MNSENERGDKFVQSSGPELDMRNLIQTSIGLTISLIQVRARKRTELLKTRYKGSSDMCLHLLKKWHSTYLRVLGEGGDLQIKHHAAWFLNRITDI